MFPRFRKHTGTSNRNTDSGVKTDTMYWNILQKGRIHLMQRLWLHEMNFTLVIFIIVIDNNITDWILGISFQLPFCWMSFGLFQQDSFRVDIGVLLDLSSYSREKQYYQKLRWIKMTNPKITSSRTSLMVKRRFTRPSDPEGYADGSISYW